MLFTPCYLSFCQEWMTSASSVLYKATKNQLYFKDVTIVLPKTWSIKSEYKKISGEKFSRAHVRIDDENPVVGKTPYVYGQTVCGAPAQYMHLTTYLLYAGKNAGYGEIGKCKYGEQFDVVFTNLM